MQLFIKIYRFKGAIEIDLDNKYESSKYKYEYSKIPLDESQSNYISIPLSIIVDDKLDAKRVGVFSYLKAHCGLNNIIGFTIPDMVEWCGGKPDRRTNGTNDKFLSIVDDISDKGYLTYLNEKSRSSYIKCRFDTSYSYKECSNGYAAIYLDELEKIMQYKKENAKDNSITNASILLVYAYLRNKIRRRPNRLEPEERSLEGIEDRKKRCPETYERNLVDIANEIGISSKTLAKIIDILEQDLELIVTDKAYRIKNKDGEFRTLPTIFTNAYKREDKYLLVTGDDYSRNEIELSAENMKKYYQDYKIDKRKRKIKKGETNSD